MDLDDDCRYTFEFCHSLGDVSCTLESDTEFSQCEMVAGTPLWAALACLRSMAIVRCSSSKN